MAKFHLNRKGEAGKCSATKGNCPFGGEDKHYTSPEAAREAFESSMSDQKLTTTTAPDAHVKEAERTLLELEPSMVERDQRQIDGTLRHQLVAAGLTEDELKNRSSSGIYNGMAGIGELTGNSEGSQRVIGLSYAPRGNEIAAVETIGESLANGDYKAGDVQVFENRGVTFLAVKTASAKSWGRSWKTDKAVQASTAAAYQDVQKASQGANQAKGSLAGGEALVVAAKDPIEAKLLHKLKEAHDAGALRVGNPRTPGDKLFYDDRDISREHKTREIHQAVAEKHANERIQDLKTRMAEKDPDSYIGYAKDDYAYGTGVAKDINDAQYNVRYRTPNGAETVYGVFTKAEAERVLDGDGLYILNNRRERRERR